MTVGECGECGGPAVNGECVLAACGGRGTTAAGTSAGATSGGADAAADDRRPGARGRREAGQRADGGQGEGVTGGAAGGGPAATDDDPTMTHDSSTHEDADEGAQAKETPDEDPRGAAAEEGATDMTCGCGGFSVVVADQVESITVRCPECGNRFGYSGPPASALDGWDYEGIVSYKIEPAYGGGMGVTDVRAVQTRADPEGPNGFEYRGVWLAEEDRACPPGGGLPESDARDWHGFREVGVVSDHGDDASETMGTVHAEPTTEGGPGPVWYWLPAEGDPAEPVNAGRGADDDDPADVNVWLEDPDTAEELCGTLRQDWKVDRVNNCVAVRENRDETESREEEEGDGR